MIRKRDFSQMRMNRQAAEQRKSQAQMREQMENLGAVLKSAQEGLITPDKMRESLPSGVRMVELRMDGGSFEQAVRRSIAEAEADGMPPPCDDPECPGCTLRRALGGFPAGYGGDDGSNGTKH